MEAPNKEAAWLDKDSNCINLQRDLNEKDIVICKDLELEFYKGYLRFTYE